MTGAIRNVVGAITGSDRAADAAIAGSQLSADAQRESLDYLKETEAIPQALREGALTGIGSEYGLTLDQEGNVISDGLNMVERAEASPLYGAIMSQRGAGEDAIARSNSMTGGLRSGNTINNLVDYNTDLQNTALMTSYNQQMQGLSGLAQLPSYAPQIAQGISGIGNTLGQGVVAAGQAEQAGYGMLLSAGSKAAGAAGFSDPRLKKNKKKVGRKYGMDWFTWDWNKAAEKIGLTGSSEGVMADLVKKVRPDLIGERDGYMTVDYGRLADSGLVKERSL